LLTYLLPDEITVTLFPVLDFSSKRIICTYTIDGQPLMDWIGKLIVGLLGGLNVKHIRVTPGRIEISIPKIDLPYRLKGLKSGAISITVKKVK